MKPNEKPDEHKRCFSQAADELLWFEDTCVDDPAIWKAVAEERARDAQRRRPEGGNDPATSPAPEE